MALFDFLRSDVSELERQITELKALRLTQFEDLKMQIAELCKVPEDQHDLFKRDRLVHTAEPAITEYADAEYEALLRDGRRLEYFDDRFYTMEDPDTGQVDYYPSSTTVLSVWPSPQLRKWREQVGPEEADRRMRTAGERGTNVHHACYVGMRGGIVIYNPYRKDASGQMVPLVWTDEQVEYFRKESGNMLAIVRDQDEMVLVQRFRELKKRIDPALLAAEMTVWNNEHRYAGTLDAIWRTDQPVTVQKTRIPAGRWIVDYKTGGKWGTHPMQLSSYEAALTERHGDRRYDGALVVYLNAQTRTDIPGVKVEVLGRDELDAAYQDFLLARKLWERQDASYIRPKVGEFNTILTF